MRYVYIYQLFEHGELIDEGSSNQLCKKYSIAIGTFMCCYYDHRLLLGKYKIVRKKEKELI